jgi:hypothetical protein
LEVDSGFLEFGRYVWFDFVIADEDAGTVFGKQQSGGAANAAGSARYDCDLACQSETVSYRIRERHNHLSRW